MDYNSIKVTLKVDESLKVEPLNIAFIKLPKNTIDG